MPSGDRPGGRLARSRRAELRAACRNRTDDLRITRVSRCVARGFRARASFMFAGCCWRRSLAVGGSSGASRGHAPVMRSPGSRWSRCHRSRQQRSERTCAHGSGGGRSYLSNLYILSAWTRSHISPAAETIPRIFRIMENAAATTLTLQGIARVRSGQAPACDLLILHSIPWCCDHGLATSRVRELHCSGKTGRAK